MCFSDGASKIKGMITHSPKLYDDDDDDDTFSHSACSHLGLKLSRPPFFLLFLFFPFFSLCFLDSTYLP